MATIDISKEPAIGNGDSIVFDANIVTWTASGGDTSTIVDNFTSYSTTNSTTNSFDQGDITVRYTDGDIIRTEEEPPKTYLQLPTGKRLISI